MSGTRKLTAILAGRKATIHYVCMRQTPCVICGAVPKPVKGRPTANRVVLDFP